MTKFVILIQTNCTCNPTTELHNVLCLFWALYFHHFVALCMRTNYHALSSKWSKFGYYQKPVLFVNQYNWKRIRKIRKFWWQLSVPIRFNLIISYFSGLKFRIQFKILIFKVELYKYSIKTNSCKREKNLNLTRDNHLIIFFTI